MSISRIPPPPATVNPVTSVSTPNDDWLSGARWVDLYVEVTGDSTIHVGRRDGGSLMSWHDNNILDVKFILVQKYNHPAPPAVADAAGWQFCEGGK